MYIYDIAHNRAIRPRSVKCSILLGLTPLRRNMYLCMLCMNLQYFENLEKIVKAFRTLLLSGNTREH